ncbi:MAG: cytidine deaminase [Pseudomonadota bacterium]
MRYEELASYQKSLLSRAESVAKNAYCPYSNFAVGAAILDHQDEIHVGANVENAAYGSTLCAERAAIVAANAQGSRLYKAIAIIAQPRTGVAKNPTAPCGACRQMLYEFASLVEGDIEVILANTEKTQILLTRVSELVPLGFGPRDLD